MKVAVVLAASVLVLLLPAAGVPWSVAALTAAAWVVVGRTKRATLARFLATTVTLGAFTYAAVGTSPTTVRLGPLGLSGTDFDTGLVVGLRLAASLLVVTLAARWIPARDLLPYATRAGLPGYVAGSLLRLVPLLRADARRLRDAQTARGHEIRAGIRGARTWLPLLVPLFVATMRRAREQSIALHLAGLAPDRRSFGPPGRRAHRWAIVVALSALAIAGRLVLVSVPGVSLSFFVLFIAGVAYGPRVGCLVGLVERSATDLVLSGFNPILVPMAAVDAALGVAAGLVGRSLNLGQRDREPFGYAAVLAASCGWLMTATFSVAADTGTWLFFLLVSPAVSATGSHFLLGALVVQGLLFNGPSMIFNAALFGTATYPVLRALRASRILPADDSLRRRERANASAP